MSVKESDASSYLNTVNLPPGSWLPPSVPDSINRSEQHIRMWNCAAS